MRGFHAILREVRAASSCGGESAPLSFPGGRFNGVGRSLAKVCATARRQLQLAFTLSVEQLERAVIVRFRHEDPGGPAQITVVRRRGIDERLRSGDAVFIEHQHEHLRVDDRAGIEKFHGWSLTRIPWIFTNSNQLEPFA